MFIVAFAALLTVNQLAAADDDLQSAIRYLLEFVEKSDVVFIRNGQEHSPKEAVAHIQKKYERFRNKIKTPEDFIRFTTTGSLLTGRPYEVRLKDGKIMLSQKWLQDALDEYRKKKTNKDTTVIKTNR
jgi:hypothetical protein